MKNPIYNELKKLKLITESNLITLSNKTRDKNIKVIKDLKTKIIFLKPRSGERYASALTKITQNNKIFQKYGKLQLKDYISSFIKSR